MVGATLLSFLQTVAPPESSDKLRQDAMAILGQCHLHELDAGRTGVVVGQVQSGKTLSYETVIALAHDSGVPLVVVISGISNPLLEQGAGRLHDDLSLAADHAWTFLKNPSSDDPTSESILRTLLDEWNDEDVPVTLRRTAVISVLKHHGQLRKLATLLTKLKVTETPLLIIDDEADQASLNTLVRRNRESTTYKALQTLRQVSRRFSYVQYTATPQALLLINITDVLSPSFVHVIAPGEAYTGGEAFFTEPSKHVKIVSAQDVAAGLSTQSDAPPSLVDALRVFFLGLAVELSTAYSPSLRRSMLIHPSQETDPHARFANWADDHRKAWMSIIDNRKTDPEDFESLLADFEAAHAELASTVSAIPALTDLTTSLKLALRRTLVIRMNAADGPTPHVPWNDATGFILVGGQAMDRGFTVQGLTVTYMPRGLGVGNADSVEQRARFFGYKQSYFGLCRVYLSLDVRDAFVEYVEHEVDIRARLQQVQEDQTPLKEWRRAFILDTMLKPTRANVLSKRALGDQVSDSWRVDESPSLDPDELETKRALRDAFLAPLTFKEDPGSDLRTSGQRHQVATGVPLADVIELLIAFPVADPSSSLSITGLIVQLEAIQKDHPHETCAVYRMRPSERSTRGLTAKDDSIKQVFQGPNATTKYPGDRGVHAESGISLQVHTFDLTDDQDKTIRAVDVPVLATWVPKRLAKGWYVQG